MLFVKFHQTIGGKSALLTAIIAGLGGKAALTGRGANIKGLVNSGTTNSKPR